jgi:hypothetical protein
LDGSTVLASSDLNSDTVVKDSTKYYVTLTGMNLVVPKDGSKTLTVAVDVKSTVDSTYRASGYASVFSLSGRGSGAVRGIDGAGLNQYVGTTAITRTVSTISTALVDAATLKISLDTNTPKSTQIIASGGTGKDEADKVTLMSFALRADYDDVLVTDLVATTSGTLVTGSDLPTLYVFDGSTEVANASVSASTGLATFSDIDINVAKGTTKILTIKGDIRTATVDAETVTASVAAVGFTAENSNGDTVTPTGSATGNQMSVAKSGAEITLVNKTTATSKTTDTSGNATTTLTATFTYNVKAVGADLVIGTNASSSEGKFASTTGYVVYTDGAAIAAATAPVIDSVDYDVPENAGTVTTNSFTVSDGNEVTMVVNVRITGRTALGTHTYAIQNNALALNGGNTWVSFMDGQSAWRTAGVTLP